MLSFTKLALYFVVINIATAGLFWLDKRAAVNRQFRIPEKTLLIFALIGGTLGAFFAQQRFRHKTKKEPFRTILYMIAILQIILVIVAVAFPDDVTKFIRNLSA